MRKFLLIFSLLPHLLIGQDEPKSFEVSGYMKNLQSWLFLNNLPQDDFLQDNLLHHRLNTKWYINEHWTFKADLRSRAFFGDAVKATANYADLVNDANNDYFDLSAVIVDSRSWVIHTMLDRLYLEYSKDKWEIRVGRQRVNWGISTIWNPNDIYNAFAFTDFDYEERPGSDALRIKYYSGVTSSIEVVAKAADHINEAVIAGMLKFNKWNYDFQLLSGIVQNEWALGGGWAGNIKNAGFKGEWTLFLPLEAQQANSFAFTLGTDYVFANGLYANIGYLYNSNGTTSDNILGLFNFELSAKNLYPYRHGILLQGSIPISPLINGSMAIIYSPVNVHPLFFNPAFTYSIATDWDLDLVGQLVFNEQGGSFQSPLQALFLRLKFSY